MSRVLIIAVALVFFIASTSADQKKCSASTECLSDEYCDYSSKLCKKGCRASTVCKDDEYCEFGSRQCKKGCRRAPNNCKSKQYCDDKRTCQDGCSTHNDCDSNEVCLTSHRCTKTCLNSPCGDDSACTIVDRKYHCTCKDGFFPEKGKGCRPKQSSDVLPKSEKELDCKKYCSELGLCKLSNNNISCYCPRISWGSPYSDCKPRTTTSATNTATSASSTQASTTKKA